MRKLIYVMVALLMFGCSTDNILKTETQTLELKQQNPIAEDMNGNLIYPNSKSLKENSLYPDFKWVEPQLNLARNNGNGKGGGKKVRMVKLSPQSEPSFSTQAIVNVMRDPVAIPETLPIPEDLEPTNSALVDWDGDGNLDLFEVHNRCYFPRSFSWVTVNGVMINNSIAYNPNLLGFEDVDGDGDLDALFAGGNHRQYNSLDHSLGGVTEPYSQYNVGYNDVDEQPVPLADILEDLVVVQDVNNPDFVVWDLGYFIDGVSQYEAYAFHIYWRPVDPVTLEFIPTEVGYQTVTYGEWGIGSSHLPVSGTVAIRFTNADDTGIDECVDKEIYVSY